MAKISIIKTPDEYTEVRQFWYQVYCISRGMLRNKANHQMQELDDSLLGKGYLFVARDEFGIAGTLLITYARETNLEDYQAFYELERLSDFPDRVAIATKLMVRPDLRGGLVCYRLLRSAVEQGIIDNISTVVFYCRDYLFDFYCKMGCEIHVDWKPHPDIGGDCCVMLHRLSGNSAMPLNAIKQRLIS